jgi:uncharacterized protein YbaR (Trm112 family)
MLDPELLKILACPKCKGQVCLSDDGDVLICEECRLRYPVRDDIPILLVEESESW